MRKTDRDLPVIVVTSAAEGRPAVEAMRVGASDYLTKPVDFDELVLAMTRALEQRDIRIEDENWRRQVREQQGAGIQGLLGTSSVMQRGTRS